MKLTKEDRGKLTELDRLAYSAYLHSPGPGVFLEQLSHAVLRVGNSSKLRMMYLDAIIMILWHVLFLLGEHNGTPDATVERFERYVEKKIGRGLKQ